MVQKVELSYTALLKGGIQKLRKQQEVGTSVVRQKFMPIAEIEIFVYQFCLLGVLR